PGIGAGAAGGFVFRAGADAGGLVTRLPVAPAGRGAGSVALGAPRLSWWAGEEAVMESPVLPAGAGPPALLGQPAPTMTFVWAPVRGVQDQVRGLDVAVDGALGVRVVDGGRDLADEADDLLRLETQAPLQDRRDRLPFHVFHGQIGEAALLSDVEEGDDIGVR